MPTEVAKASSLPAFMLEAWLPGTLAHFEYHCLESLESSDAELWLKSHQPVTVLSLDAAAENDLLGGLAERLEAAMPLVYRVRFSDGSEGSVWEDELMTSPAGFYRPAPPVLTA